MKNLPPKINWMALVWSLGGIAIASLGLPQPMLYLTVFLAGMEFGTFIESLAAWSKKGLHA